MARVSALIEALCSGCGAKERVQLSSWTWRPDPPEGWVPYHQPSGVIYCPSCVAKVESAEPV